jgi:hypothetical protein
MGYLVVQIKYENTIQLTQTHDSRRRTPWHKQVRRSELIDDAAHTLGGLADWRGGRLTLERQHHHRRAGEGLDPTAAGHD